MSVKDSNITTQQRILGIVPKSQITGAVTPTPIIGNQQQPKAAVSGDNAAAAIQPQKAVQPVASVPPATSPGTKVTGVHISPKGVQPTPPTTPVENVEKKKINPADMTIVTADNNPDHGVLQSDLKKYTGWDGELTPEEQSLLKKRNLTYDEIDKIIDRNVKATEPETKEEKQKREKKEKWNKIINAIGDGVSSLANLYYTSKGGLNTYNPNSSLSKAYQDRLDKQMQLRKESNANYLNYALKKLDLINDEYNQKQKDQDRIAKYIESAQKAAATDKTNNLNAELLGMKVSGQDAINKKNEALAKKTQSEADAAQSLLKAKLELEQAQTATQKAAAKQHIAEATKAYADAKSNRIRALKTGSSKSASGSGHGKAKYYGSLTVGGHTYNYSTKSDYDKAVAEFANRYHVNTSQVQGGVKLRDGRIVGGKTQARKTNEIAADVENRSRTTHRPAVHQHSATNTRIATHGKTKLKGF